MKVIRFVLIAIIQISCSNTNQNKTLTSRKYEIISILFNGKYTSMEEMKEIKPNLTYENTTDTVQKIIIDPKPIFETSSFNLRSDCAMTIVDSNKLISVPQYVNNSDFFLGERKWKYVKHETRMLTKLKDSIYVQPHKNLSASTAVVFYKIKSEYIIILRDVETREMVKLNGEWIGFIPTRLECAIIFQN